MSSPSAVRSAPAAGASSASCWSKPSSSPAPAPSLALLRLTGLQSFPCCFLRIPFQPNPSSASTLPSSRSPSRSRCSAASSSVLSPHCVSRVTIPRVCSPAGRLALSLLPQSIAGAFSSPRKSRSRFFSWPLRAPPSAAFLRLMQMPLGYDPANVMKLGIMLHVQDPGEWSRIQSREARIAYIEQIREKIASVPGVSTVAVGRRCHAALYWR